ncbi:putative bifunctional diguanylate cyclase/phosphodiesterase [Spongorhabdus nitratireducens]
MTPQNTGRPQTKLSLRLFKVVMLSACFIGIVLSTIQIIFDAYNSGHAIDTEAKQMLSMVRDPATRAAYRIEEEMAVEVLEGLFEIESIQYAAIVHPDQKPLAEMSRPFSKSRYRRISDQIFDRSRIYRTPLTAEEPYPDYFGDIVIHIDTAYYGRNFIRRGIVIMLSGLVRAATMALLLYLIYSLILTRPLNRMIRNLSKIDPEHPGKEQLPYLKGHRNNELGLWVRTANQLLRAIERNFNLRQKAEAQILKLSQYDYLTRLPNQRTLQKHLRRLIKNNSKQPQRFAILCIGPDHFTEINAQYNFHTGDHLLVKLADRLRDIAGNGVYTSRLGGDQFCMVQPLEQPAEAAELAQKILRDLGKPFDTVKESITIEASIGISVFPDDGHCVEELLQQAEAAMLLAKSRRNLRYQFYIASLDQEIRERKKLEADLHHAVDHDELHLVFQPQVKFSDHARIIGAEALLRWTHPEKGLVSPDIFIPLAENSRDIIAIGDWVLETGCRQLHDWQQQGYRDIVLAVNLSAIQLQDDELPDRVAQLLKKYDIAPHTLELEITETSLINDVERSCRQLRAIKDIGVKLALDDFGTGYSSLSYLKRFPFDKVKIDRSFVDGLPENSENNVIVNAIIQLGKSFKMTVLAEGVETLQQEQYLTCQECDEGQGYYYSKPVSPDAFESMIRDQNREYGNG